MLQRQMERCLHCDVFKEILTLAQIQLTSRQQKIVTALVFFVLAILWACYAHHFNPPIFPLDDGYIYLHNAQVLHLGYDRNYPGVSALDGSTSPVYLLLVTLLLFIWSPLWALQIAVWLGVLVYALGLLRLAFIYTKSFVQSLLFLVGGLTIAYMPFQLFNGVETGWAMAAVTWILILVSEEKTLRRRILIGVLCGVLPFLRPELIIFSIWIMLWQAWCHYRSAENNKDCLLAIFTDLSVVLIAAAPWVIWYWCSTGQPYPMTITAKSIFVAQSCLPEHFRNYYFLHHLALFSQLLGSIIVLGMLILLGMTALGRVVLASLICFLVMFWLYMPIAIVSNNLRYLYPLIPLFLYGIVSCVNHGCMEIRWVANFLLVLMTLCMVTLFPQKWRQYIADAHVMTDAAIGAANWCNAHLPPGSVILIHDAGYMALATPFHLIDLVGLKTPAAIYYQQKYFLDGCKMQRGAATAAIIHRYHPGYMITLPDWEQGFGVMRNRERLGWSAKLLYKTSAEGYRIYKVKILH